MSLAVIMSIDKNISNQTEMMEDYYNDEFFGDDYCYNDNGCPSEFIMNPEEVMSYLREEIKPKQVKKDKPVKSKSTKKSKK